MTKKLEKLKFKTVVGSTGQKFKIIAAEGEEEKDEKLETLEEIKTDGKNIKILLNENVQN
jgi:hypothetical protein